MEQANMNGVSEEFIQSVKRMWDGVKRALAKIARFFIQWVNRAVVAALQLESLRITSVLAVTKKTVARKILRRRIRALDERVRHLQGGARDG